MRPRGVAAALRRRPRGIEFLCAPEDRGVIAEPYPARGELPGWFRDLPPVDRSALSATDNGQTVKRCMPFFDAMTTGWIIPLAATVRLEIRDGGREFTAGWEFDRVMVSNHSAYQVAGNPDEPRPPGKLHNYWTVRTPPGWSCLFVAPLNRDQGPVKVLSGIVNTDRYRSRVNFPFVPVGEDGVHVLPRAAPLVQVIPFRRATTGLAGTVRAERPGEEEERERIHRSTLASDGWYRLRARARR